MALGSKTIGADLEVKKPCTVADLELTAIFYELAHPGSLLHAVSEGQQHLWDELKGGGITAMALKVETGLPVQVPKLEWEYLKVLEVNGRRDVLTVNGLETVYREVRLPRQSVIRTWHESPAPAGTEAVAAAIQKPRSDDEVVARYIEMRASMVERYGEQVPKIKDEMSVMKEFGLKKQDLLFARPRAGLPVNKVGSPGKSR